MLLSLPPDLLRELIGRYVGVHDRFLGLGVASRELNRLAYASPLLAFDFAWLRLHSIVADSVDYVSDIVFRSGWDPSASAALRGLAASYTTLVDEKLARNFALAKMSRLNLASVEDLRLSILTPAMFPFMKRIFPNIKRIRADHFMTRLDFTDEVLQRDPIGFNAAGHSDPLYLAADFSIFSHLESLDLFCGNGRTDLLGGVTLPPPKSMVELRLNSTSTSSLKPLPTNLAESIAELSQLRYLDVFFPVNFQKLSHLRHLGFTPKKDEEMRSVELVPSLKLSSLVLNGVYTSKATIFPDLSRFANTLRHLTISITHPHVESRHLKGLQLESLTSHMSSHSAFKELTTIRRLALLGDGSYRPNDVINVDDLTNNKDLKYLDVTDVKFLEDAVGFPKLAPSLGQFRLNMNEDDPRCQKVYPTLARFLSNLSPQYFVKLDLGTLGNGAELLRDGINHLASLEELRVNLYSRYILNSQWFSFLLHLKHLRRFSLLREGSSAAISRISDNPEQKIGEYVKPLKQLEFLELQQVFLVEDQTSTLRSYLPQACILRVSLSKTAALEYTNNDDYY